MRKVSKGKILMLCGLVAIILAVGTGIMQAMFKPYEESHKYMMHKNVDCEQCHGTHVENTVKEAAKIYNKIIGNKNYKAQKVDPAKCAACHNGSFPQAKDVVNQGANEEGKNTKFVHAVHYEEGFNCIDCHRTVAHGNMPFNPNDPQIPNTWHAFCAKCHDVRTINSKGNDSKEWPYEQACTKCHKFDPKDNPNAFFYRYDLRHK